MSAYQAKPTHAFKHRVTDSKGKSGVFSTGTADPATKEAVVALVARLKAQRRWDVLDAIVGKKAKLKLVFDADQRGELDAYMAGLSDTDLSPLVFEWSQSGAPARYVRQVLRLIPYGVLFPASRFTKAVVSKHLSNLPDARAHKSKRSVSGSTRNRHRAALFQFARWLVERDVLESNPVRDVRGHKENPARMVSYDWKQAKAIIDALPLPYRAMEALMAGTGMEWSAVMALRLSDVDFDTRDIAAKGTKNRHRNRTVRVTEPWAWSIFEKYAKGFTFPAEKLFDLDPKTAIVEHRKALVSLGLPDSTLHDWRHTYAVNKLREGMRPAVVRHQLGHAKNSTEVERIYGVHDITDSDFETTTSATTAKKQREVKRAN